MMKTSAVPATARACSTAAAGPSGTNVKSCELANRTKSGSLLVTTKNGGVVAGSAPYPISSVPCGPSTKSNNVRPITTAPVASAAS